MAHRGVLFLDEFPEFGTRVLEAMRQPMEDKVVTVSHAKGSLTFSANFQLIAVTTQLDLSTRAYHRILKLACTIADLVGREETQSAEADVEVTFVLSQYLQVRVK